MTGGFFQEEPFKIEQVKRTAGGNLVSDITAIKRRLFITFSEILPADYAVWVGEQKLDEWREIEYENMDGSFTKVVVDFKKDHLREFRRTKSPWLYSQVVFTMEEV